MYYPDEVIESVRQGSDIVDVVSQYVKLQRRGANYFGLCPFHNEKSPSFSVTPSKQMYYCFGCGAGGNAITFLMEYENYSFQEAVQTLAERAGIPLPQVEQTEEERRKSNRKQILLEIQKEAARYFYFQLRSEQGKIGYDYLKGRGLQEETIRSFGLGYSLAYSNDLYQYLKKKGYTDDILRDSGLITYEERGIHDKFWNRVMFPIMDINSKVIGFGGRVMGDGKPKYLNSPETMIFDKSRNLYGMHVARRTKKPYFLICEGYMDVISLHQAGFTNAVAALGTAFTIQHGILMKRYTKEVILTFDSDEAGQKAALRALPILKSAGLAVKVLDMKPYKDPDEFLPEFPHQKIGCIKYIICLGLDLAEDLPLLEDSRFNTPVRLTGMGAPGLFIAADQGLVAGIHKYDLVFVPLLPEGSQHLLHIDKRPVGAYIQPQYNLVHTALGFENQFHKFIDKPDRKVIYAIIALIFENLDRGRLTAAAHTGHYDKTHLSPPSCRICAAIPDSSKTLAWTSSISRRICAEVAPPLLITNPQCFSETWAPPTL